MFKEEMVDRVLASELSQIAVGIAEKLRIRQAMAEMFQILKHSNQEIRSCIPKKVYANA